MSNARFPTLEVERIAGTRDALHAYARVIGAWAAGCRQKRKHWWHASLRPSLNGVTTGVIHAAVDFELELDWRASLLHLRTVGKTLSQSLTGQPSRDIAALTKSVLVPLGVDESFGPGEKVIGDDAFAAYDVEIASRLHAALASANGAMVDLRAGIREEASPIQVWPHHFDLSMLWLPGPKVPGQDVADEEYADKQMNIGFVFGDAAVPEPYFYVTAYPLPDALPNVALPAGAEWRSDGFSGAVALYRDVAATNDPQAFLLQLWQTLLEAGRQHLAVDG